MFVISIDGVSPFADGIERVDAQGGARSRVPHGDLGADHQGGRLHGTALPDLRKSVG